MGNIECLGTTTGGACLLPTGRPATPYVVVCRLNTGSNDCQGLHDAPDGIQNATDHVKAKGPRMLGCAVLPSLVEVNRDGQSFRCGNTVVKNRASSAVPVGLDGVEQLNCRLSATFGLEVRSPDRSISEGREAAVSRFTTLNSRTLSPQAGAPHNGRPVAVPLRRSRSPSKRSRRRRYLRCCDSGASAVFRALSDTQRDKRLIDELK